MRPLRVISLAMVTLLAGVQCDRSTPDVVWIQQARSLTDEFQAKLKRELLTAMKGGGPVRAIQVCNVEAPRIASQIAAGRVAGWTVSRTALRVRNPKNRPNDWQNEALVELERRIAAGEPLDQVAWQGRRDGQFVYMRPIMMDGACMTCHGPAESIPASVATEIERLYPDDKATGFSLGDLRGAFVVAGPTTRR